MRESAAALHDLKTFNRMVAGHPELADRLIGGEYRFLQWQQAQIFASFRAYRTDAVGAARSMSGKGMTAGLFVSGAAACALTACALLFRKPAVAIFSVDKISAPGARDFRIDGLYGFLEKRGVAYVEIFHTMLGRAFFRNAWSRKRCAVYHEAFDFLASLVPDGAADEARRIAASLPCGEFDEADRPFARAVAEKCLRKSASSRAIIRWYRRALARLKPRAILAIDDTRHYHELIAAAKAFGVPAYAFQHGHFTKYHAGWLDAGVGRGGDARPDALFVWNPYWKKELLRIGTDFEEDEIRVGGNPKGGASHAAAKPYAPPADGRLEILVPFETDAPHEEVARGLKALADSGRVKIWLKTRPDWDAEEQLRIYGLAGSGRERAEATPDAAPVLDRIHAVMGVFTSYLYEAVAMRKPVLLLRTSMDGGEGMIVNGLADEFDAQGPDAAERLAAACRTAAPKLESRAEAYLRGEGDLTATLEELLPEA